jgi:hypothetical protein
LHFTKNTRSHRWADTPVGSVGVSFGGGQPVCLHVHSYPQCLIGHQ